MISQHKNSLPNRPLEPKALGRADRRINETVVLGLAAALQCKPTTLPQKYFSQFAVDFAFSEECLSRWTS
jgi:hypothetical protein